VINRKTFGPLGGSGKHVRLSEGDVLTTPTECSEGGPLCFAPVFKLYFSDFFQTNYLNIHWTDLCEMYRNGRTLAVDDDVKLFFRFLKGRCHGNHFCGLNSHAVFRPTISPKRNEIGI